MGIPDFQKFDTSIRIIHGSCLFDQNTCSKSLKTFITYMYMHIQINMDDRLIFMVLISIK
jgi:hypothetical protein